MKWPLMKNSITWRDKLALSRFILTSDRFTQGEEVKSFEREWSSWCDKKYSVFVNSGSSANLLLLSAITELYKVEKNARILTSVSTWATTVSPILQLGYTPVFCDTDLGNFCFDIPHLRKLSKQYGDQIKVLFVPHLLGLKAPVDLYKDLFPKAIVIEDCCESHGVITEGEASTYSFYFGHHMTTVEGGMISTNNRDLYNLLLMKRSHGLARESLYYNRYKEENKQTEGSFLFMTSGFNLRNTELSAVLGKLQLKKLDNWIDIRRKNYKKFVELIEEYDQFTVPEKQTITNSSFCLPFIVKNPTILQNLKEKFKENSIEYRPIIAGNLLKHPAYKDFGNLHDFPNADTIHFSGIYIGNNQFVNNKNFKLLKKILEQICKK